MKILISAALKIFIDERKPQSTDPFPSFFACFKISINWQVGRRTPWAEDTSEIKNKQKTNKVAVTIVLANSLVFWNFQQTENNISIHRVIFLAT